VLAAIGVAQMEQFPELLQNKRRMDQFYRSELKGIGDITFQEVDPNVKANCWLFTLKTNKMRELLEYLNNNGVQSRPFWMPMNQLEMFKNDLYITESDQSNHVYETSISIPSSAGITQSEMEVVVRTIKSFYTNH
jgi:dTDP-4-amino-4,6-dideoxygalactose transaminase